MNPFLDRALEKQRLENFRRLVVIKLSELTKKHYAVDMQ